MTEVLTRKEVSHEKRIALAVIGDKGAVHFWMEHYTTEQGRTERFGGLERHDRKPRHGGKPDHENCWLLDAPCWHDGSSLAADEWIPIYLSCKETDRLEYFWDRLERTYRNMFREEDEDEPEQ